MSETPTVDYNTDDAIALGAMHAVALLDPDRQREVRLSARVVGQSLENDALRKDLEIDKKTGLFNESYWKNCVQNELAKLSPGESLTVQVADVNGFKQVNDKLGHAAGDELLVLIGRAFSSVYQRETDISAHGSRENSPSSIARLGGDEFATMIVNNTNGQRLANAEDQALEQSKRINDVLKEILSGTKFEKFRTSLSIGSASSEPGDTVDTIFARADAKMFETKYKNKIDQLTKDDRERLKVIIPYLENEVKTRVEGWLREAIFPTNNTSPENQDHIDAPDQQNLQK